MRATGIVRRIDELGRVVIPKEIRRTQRIRQGDALEIFTEADGKVIFRKYSQMAELNELAGVYAEVLAKQLSAPVMVCDRDTVVAVSGGTRGELLGKHITPELEKLLSTRGVYIAPRDAARRVHAVTGVENRILECAVPIVVSGDIEGGVCLLGNPKADPPDNSRTGAVRIAAAFLARWMEE